MRIRRDIVQLFRIKHRKESCKWFWLLVLENVWFLRFWRECMDLNFDSFSDEEFRSTVSYIATNETVEAIVESLSVKSDDIILTVCGSGDIPFALLEKGAKVIAVDVSGIQIQYAEWRMKKLESGDVDTFFRFIDSGRGEKNTLNRDYFSLDDRLTRIKEYAPKIEFLKSNVFRTTTNDLFFNKIYLSNTLGFGDNSCDLAGVASCLVSGGLLYITQDRFYNGSRFFDLPAGLVDDSEQTAVAREYEKFWVNPGPSVLRKEK